MVQEKDPNEVVEEPEGISVEAEKEAGTWVDPPPAPPVMVNEIESVSDPGGIRLDGEGQDTTAGGPTGTEDATEDEDEDTGEDDVQTTTKVSGEDTLTKLGLGDKQGDEGEAQARDASGKFTSE